MNKVFTLLSAASILASFSLFYFAGQPNTAPLIQSSIVTKTPNQKPIDPGDNYRETGSECYTRLNCGKKGSTRACYLCCDNGCTDKVGCQNKCDGLTAEHTGWSVEFVQQIRNNPAVWEEALTELKDPNANKLSDAYKLSYLFETGQDIADTRLVVALSGGLMIENPEQDIVDICSVVVSDALHDSRDPGIRRTALAMTKEAYGVNAIETWEATMNALLTDEDQSVRDLAFIYVQSM